MIELLFSSLTLAIDSYLPIDAIPNFKKEAADFFLKKAKKESNDKSLQRFCIDKAIYFISQKENMELAAEWILSGKVMLDGDDLNCKLTPP